MGERALVHQSVLKPDDRPRCCSRQTVASPLCCPPFRNTTRPQFYSSVPICRVSKVAGPGHHRITPCLYAPRPRDLSCWLGDIPTTASAGLSWAICAGTGLVYTAYVVAAILPILFPQCPYRTPLCDLIYVAFCRFIPQVTWTWRKPFFISGLKEGNFSRMYHNLPRILARKQQSLTMIESDSVQHTSTNLAAEALHWLLSVTSNPTVQSIAMQSISGLPMASEERLLALRENIAAVDAASWRSLLGHTTLQTKDSYCEPVPSMELKLGTFTSLLSSRFPGARIPSFLPLTSTLLSLPPRSYAMALPCMTEKHLNLSFLSHFSWIVARSSKLPPRCWFRLMNESHVLRPVDPDNDDPTNMVPLYLCSTILHSFKVLQSGLTQGFDSPLVLHFEDALTLLP